MKKFFRSQTHVASRVAQGPGSLAFETWPLRLARSGRFAEAAKAAIAHNREVGRHCIPQFTIMAWAATPDNDVLDDVLDNFWDNFI